METKYIVGILAAALLLGTYVAEFAVDSGGASAAITYSGPEALKWLRGNESESALASNRFGETSQATRFVKQLYNAGAEKVIVLEESIRSDEYETYADSLVITLPEDAEGRRRVLDLCAPELAREGLSVGDFDGEKQILLWWD